MNIVTSAGPGGPRRKEAQRCGTLLKGAALGVLLVSLAACGGSGTSSAAQQTLQQKADLWDIDQIEKNFHKATTTQDIDLMMSLWAPNATFTIGSRTTAAGREEIRQFWLEKSIVFQPETHWVSDHPAYKVRITVNGDQGTLYFECHYVDTTTSEVVAGHGRRPGGRADRRTVVDHQPGGRDRPP